MSYAVGILSQSARVQILPPLPPGGSDLTLCLGLLICKNGAGDDDKNVKP